MASDVGVRGPDEPDCRPVHASRIPAQRRTVGARLLSDLPHRNCWTIAEWSEEATRCTRLVVEYLQDARRFEAQREGWLGEVEGLEISYLAYAEDQWTQLDAALKPSAIHLGLPAFGEIAARTI